MLFRVIALALCAAGLASAHEFQVCKGHQDRLGVSAITVQPDPPHAGQALTVRVQGKPELDLMPGTLAVVEVRVFGVVMSTTQVDLCAEMACPVLAGTAFDVALTQDIPEGTPAHLTAVVRLQAHTADKQELSCLETSMELEEHAGLGAPDAVEAVFQAWKRMWPKVEARASVFKANWLHIVQHNADRHATYRMAMNEFGSLTPDEFAATRMGLKESSNTKERSKDHVPQTIRLRSDVARADPPPAIDWTELGKVTPVKNQGACGSCWAFSTVAAVESAFAIHTGNLVELSEQELVSCDRVDSACQGGLMDNAFEWIERNTAGLCTEEAYPYVSGTSGARGECLQAQCEAVPGTVPKAFVDIQPNEAALQAAVATHGPVAVAIEADQSAFQFYHSGVMQGTCGARLDHGVLLVGYGEEDGVKFWKIKNSWGATWGEQGYIRIVRGKRWPRGGECGIAAAASFPVFE